MSIGHSPNEPQWTPDMKKADQDISEKERADAKRRIEGSLAPPPEGSSSGGMSSALKQPMSAFTAGLGA
jgi:phosphatidylserine decarboxylase